MKCEKCKAMMIKKEDELFEKRIKIYFCDRCGNKLIPLNEVIKLQEMVSK